MSVSFENKETNRGVLTFTISQDQIKPALDRVFESVKKNLNVPGFRKGHLPRPIFNQRFGEESLYQDALNDLLPAAYDACQACASTRSPCLERTGWRSCDGSSQSSKVDRWGACYLPGGSASEVLIGRKLVQARTSFFYSGTIFEIEKRFLIFWSS